LSILSSLENKLRDPAAVQGMCLESHAVIKAFIPKLIQGQIFFTQNPYLVRQDSRREKLKQ